MYQHFDSFSDSGKHEKGLHAKLLDFPGPHVDNKGIENNQIQILVRQRGLNQLQLRGRLRPLSFNYSSPFRQRGLNQLPFAWLVKTFFLTHPGQ